MQCVKLCIIDNFGMKNRIYDEDDIKFINIIYTLFEEKYQSICFCIEILEYIYIFEVLRGNEDLKICVEFISRILLISSHTYNKNGQYM